MSRANMQQDFEVKIFLNRNLPLVLLCNFCIIKLINYNDILLFFFHFPPNVGLHSAYQLIVSPPSSSVCLLASSRKVGNCIPCSCRRPLVFVVVYLAFVLVVHVVRTVVDVVMTITQPTTTSLLCNCRLVCSNKESPTLLWNCPHESI